MAIVTEAAVITKAYFDLRFQNPRITDEKERNREDQTDCKAVAGSLISVVTDRSAHVVRGDGGEVREVPGWPG